MSRNMYPNSDTGPELYLAPASKQNDPRPYHHLQKTVLSPVSADEIYGLPLRFDEVPIWGVTKSTWERYSPAEGDFVLFYTGNGEYEYVAEIVDTETQSGIAKDLWSDYVFQGTDHAQIPGKPYSGLLYFETVWEPTLSGKQIQRLQRARDPVTRSFNRIKKRRFDAAEFISGNRGDIVSEPTYSRERSRYERD